MDTSLFDNIYSEWSEEIPEIIKKSLTDIFGDGPLVDEELVNSWTNLLLQDSTKYDILMWIKAKTNISFSENGKIPFTESTIKQLYLVEDDEMLKQFRDGKNRCKRYYKEKLFEYEMPPFFMYVYSKNQKSKYNPFCRNDCDVKLDSFFALKEDLMYYVDRFIDRIPDEEIKKCQKITTAYYLENTYGFHIKKIIAEVLTKVPHADAIYQPDYRKLLIQRVLSELFQEKALHINLPEKYQELDIRRFYKLISYSTAPEFKFLKESLDSSKTRRIVLNSKYTPEPGYLLLVLLMAKTVLTYYLADIANCCKIAKPIIDTDLIMALSASEYISKNTLLLIDKMLTNLTFSAPGDKDFTCDEKCLLANIDAISTDIPVKNEAFSKDPDFVKTLHTHARNNEPSEMYDIQKMIFDVQMPIQIYMPDEAEVLNRFVEHYNSAYTKARKQRFFNSTNKHIKRMPGIAIRVSKHTLLSCVPKITPEKLSGTEVRTFKNLVIELMNNCFNSPTISEPSIDPKLNYAVRKISTKSNAMETLFDSSASYFQKMYRYKFNLLSLNNNIFMNVLNNELNECNDLLFSHYNRDIFLKKVLHDCIFALYGKIVKSFDSPDEIRKYFSRIYNSEVLEHANKNLCFEGKIDCSRISKEIQKRIAELN